MSSYKRIAILFVMFFLFPLSLFELHDEQTKVIRLEATIAQQQLTIDRMSGTVRHSIDVISRAEKPVAREGQPHNWVTDEKPFTAFTWPDSGVATSRLPESTPVSYLNSKTLQWEDAPPCKAKVEKKKEVKKTFPKQGSTEILEQVTESSRWER